jgi:Tfp pilus assembly protein PilF
MAKQRRDTPARSSGKRRASAKRGSVRRPVASAAAQPLAASDARTVLAAPAAPVRKPAYYEAIALYESGVRALQRHDFAAAADQFRTVVQRFPDERELLERARLYLRVCERETANRPAGPKTPQERIYAATVALNAGDSSGALAHLRQALAEDPDSDYGHYIMSVALTELAEFGDAIEFLRQAIALNPENRSLARQDPDLAVLRETVACRQLLDAVIPPVRRRPRPKR